MVNVFHNFVLQIFNLFFIFSFQDLMNREKRDKIPSMQVSFIDAICVQLYEASSIQILINTTTEGWPTFLFDFRAKSNISLLQTLAGMSEHCSPLLEGCQRNRQHWKRLAEECEKGLVNGLV